MLGPKLSSVRRELLETAMDVKTLPQGIQARTPKVVLLKVSLHILLVWPVYSLTDP